MTQQMLMASAAHMGGGGPPPDFDWIDVWDGVGGQNAISGFANRTFRIRVPATAFAGVTGTKVRVTFKAGADDMTIANAYVGNAALLPGDADGYDFASTPTRLTFDTGSDDVAITAGAEEVSDGVDFVVDGAHDLLISFHNADCDAPFFMFPSNQEGVKGWMRGSPGDDSSTVDAVAYVIGAEVHYAIYGVVELEIWGETGTVPGPIGTYPVSCGLINPGGELGDDTGWTSLLGSGPQIRSTTDDGVDSRTGTHHFAVSADQAEAKWYQDFDLTGLADWADIEPDIALGLVQAKFGAWIFSFAGAESDTSAPWIIALDSVGDPLGFRYLIESDPPQAWTQRVVSMVLPPGTETLRVGIIGTRTAGTQLANYIDDMTLDLAEYQPTAPDPFSDLVIFHFTADVAINDDAALSPLPFGFHGGWGVFDPGDGNNVLKETGTSDTYVDYPEAQDPVFYLRGQDFTVEGYVTWPNDTSLVELFSHHGNGSFFGRQSYIFGIEDGLYFMRMWDSILGEIRIDATTPITVDTRQHVAFERNGSTIQIMLDGVQVATGTFAAIVQDGFAFESRNALTTGNLDGFMVDDWRFTKGVCRYPEDFTVPATLERPDPFAISVNAHQFYRINITANNGDATYTSPGLIEMYEGYQRTNKCINGTPMGSKAGAFGNTPDKSFKTDFSGRYVDLNGGLWCGYRFPVPVNIQGLMLRAFADQQAQSPSAFDFDHSDDGHEWETDWSQSALNFTDAGIWKPLLFWNPSYDPGSYSGSYLPQAGYWRVAMIRHNADTFSCAEIEFATTPAGADECTGGTAITNDASFGTTAANAFDNNNSSLYAPSNGDGKWIGYQLPSPKAMEEYRWRSRSDTAPAQNPLRSAMQYSLDGSDWSTAWEGFDTTAWTLGEVRTFADPLYV